MSATLVFRSRRVVTPTGEAAASVVVIDGTIVAIEPHDHPAGSARVIDVGRRALMPGLIDTHVHLNEPGRSEWEGFDSGTRAAAAGGITTLIDMPLNSVPPVTSAAGLAAKRAAAEGRCHVDVGFWGGVVPDNGGELQALWDAGVFGFKCFLAPSGVPEFEHVDAADLVRVLPVLVPLGAPLLVHAESPAALLEPGPGADPRAYATWLDSRPDAAEADAVRLLVDLCRETRARMHIVHVASADVPPLLREAQRETLPVTAETCPHYLHFAAEAVPAGGTQWKCAPPIRAAATREALWHALGRGELNMIGSDHSPAPPALKESDGDFLAAWGGIASLQLALPIVWTGARARRFTLRHVAEWMAAAPARLAGLAYKGSIEVGHDADFAVFDTHADWTVDAHSLHHRHALTPYDGQRLTGAVRATYLRGELIYDAAQGHGPPCGRVLARH